jgi:NAD(P)-dependent dehydrogenase (short-subunit alcohol dehydrogenase family)
MNHLEKRVFIVTGAAVGLGYATADELASTGADLTLVDYDAAALKTAKRTLGEKYPDIALVTVVGDVSNEDTAKTYVAETLKVFGRIDGLYNNAGIEGRQAPFAAYNLDTFQKVIDINLMGVYYGMRYVIPVMQEQQYGRIVNASSVGGIRGVVNQTAYVASKHAVVGMTKNAAIEYAKDNILTNAIAPGAIMTPMVEEAFRQIDPKDPEGAARNFASRNPTRRLGVPADVAKVVAFLLSADNGYVNGQTIAIDGGESELYGNA